MSVSRCVYFRASRAPAAERWLHAAQQAGFDVSFETDFDVLDGVDGFLPVVLDGKEAGFELYAEQAADMSPAAHVSAAIGDRDACLAFVTHSDFRGLATAVIAAAVLAEITDGVVYDEESDEVVSAADALGSARALLREIQGKL